MDTSSLMEQILSKDNLNAAYLQVVRNKGAAGVDGMTVEELGAYLSENGESIREKLRTRKYKPQPVRRVEIPKPEGGTRKLGVPTVVDRFVQQAVAQVLTPIFEEQFHDHSYGFRPNRCGQQAVLKALEMMNGGHSWIVDIDLAKFFDTVDHDKLMTIFGRTKVKDYILSEFKYDRNNEQGEITLLKDVGVYWERKYIDCWDATNMMCLFAKELGLESRLDCSQENGHNFV